MRVKLLKGHERGISSLVYNREGDLLFSTGKDPTINCWFADSGVRLGTYSGHNGAVWGVDVSHDSTHLISASADQTVRLWEVETGKQLYCFKFDIPVRAINFAQGEKMFLTATDNVYSKPSSIQIFSHSDDISELSESPMKGFECGKYKITQAKWGPMNEKIFSVSSDNKVHVWDPQTGKLLTSLSEHTKAVNSIEFAQDYSCFITASSDHTARLYDTKTLELLKTYETGRPLNGASISPIMDHVLLVGGQPASEVTTTRVDPSQFAARVYHKVFQEEMALVMGHFGTVNTITYSPDGKSFVTGGEDGYIRLHFLDDNYFRGLSNEEFYGRK